MHTYAGTLQELAEQFGLRPLSPDTFLLYEWKASKWHGAELILSAQEYLDDGRLRLTFSPKPKEY